MLCMLLEQTRALDEPAMSAQNNDDQDSEVNNTEKNKGEVDGAKSPYHDSRKIHRCCYVEDNKGTCIR